MFQILSKSARASRGRTVLLVALAIVCIGWGAYTAIEAYRPETTARVRLAVGSTVERRYQIAEYLATEARDANVDVELVSTNGFNEAMAQVSAGTLDAAIISSGLKVAHSEEIRVLAGLDLAPLHILARRELVASGASLVDLIKGHRINLGEQSTSDHELACEVLKYLHIAVGSQSSPGDFVDVSMSKTKVTELAIEIKSLSGADRQQRARELPDVNLFVGSLPSKVAQVLLDTDEYVLVPFPYAQPFLMTDSDAGSDGLNRLYIESAHIPAAMYLGSQPQPSAECASIGMRTLLVARADLPADTVRRLMRTIFETPFAQRIKPLSPRDIATTYGVHEGAAAYLDGNKPLVTGEFFENISKGLSVFGAFSAGALSLYGYMRRRRIRRPGEYLEEIRMVDALATNRDADAGTRKMPESLARDLDARLIKLKEQLIEDYCNNRVQGELVLMSILSMLSDSRAQLRRSNEQVGHVPPREDAAADISRRAA